MSNLHPFDLGERLLEFAVSVVRLTEEMIKTRASNHVAGQLLRSGTSALPNHGEAQAAESNADFIHKMSICLKELRETERGRGSKHLQRSGLKPLRFLMIYLSFRLARATVFGATLLATLGASDTALFAAPAKTKPKTNAVKKAALLRGVMLEGSGICTFGATINPGSSNVTGAAFRTIERAGDEQRSIVSSSSAMPTEKGATLVICFARGRPAVGARAISARRENPSISSETGPKAPATARCV